MDIQIQPQEHTLNVLQKPTYIKTGFDVIIRGENAYTPESLKVTVEPDDADSIEIDWDNTTVIDGLSNTQAVEIRKNAETIYIEGPIESGMEFTISAGVAALQEDITSAITITARITGGETFTETIEVKA